MVSGVADEVVCRFDDVDVIFSVEKVVVVAVVTAGEDEVENVVVADSSMMTTHAKITACPEILRISA